MNVGPFVGEVVVSLLWLRVSGGTLISVPRVAGGGVVHLCIAHQVFASTALG